MNDVELLQRFEPIVRYTQGEMFFPAAVETYVNRRGDLYDGGQPA